MALRHVIGQDGAIGILLRTLSRDRIPSAYLFSGEAGIGKKFAAINLAKAINCLKEQGAFDESVGRDEKDDPSRVAHHMGQFDACDDCPSCKKTDAGTHPDFVIVTPERGEIRVGEIRAVEEALSFKPYEGLKKIIVIDDADTMNQSAANAFLKTLEEPPDESLLILVSSNPDKLPETIRSRCSRVGFAPLPPSDCEEVIVNVAVQQAYSGDREEEGAARLAVAVRLSMGRPGLAVSSDMMKERDRSISLFSNMIEGHGDPWTDKEEMERWFETMLLLLRDMAVFKIEGETSPGIGPPGEILMNSDMKDFISTMSKTVELGSIMEAYRSMIFLKKRLAFNLNKAVTWNYVSAVMQDLRVKIQETRPGY